MEKRLNVEKIREALKRAGRTALTGSNEARSGKLLYHDAVTGRFDSKLRKRRAGSERAVEKKQ